MKYILNGRLIEADEILLPVDKNGSFWYGDGFFESMKSIDGKLLFEELHWERIMTCCNILQMKNPFSEFQDFKQHADVLVGDDMSPKRVKLTLWRHTWNSYQPEDTTVEYLLNTYPYPDREYKLNTSGLRLVTYRENLKPVSVLGNLKSTSSQLMVMASIYIASKGVEDAIILNTSGNVIETSRSNIWIRKGGQIITPPLSEGCLNGIMRRVIMDSQPDGGYTIAERPISHADLMSADEVFTSSAVRGVQWVSRIDQSSYKDNTICKKLSQLINEKVGIL